MGYLTLIERRINVAWNGPRLRRARMLREDKKGRRWTQAILAAEATKIAAELGLADKFGKPLALSMKMISDYERGVEQPRADQLMVICLALKIDPKYPMELTKHMPLIELSNKELSEIVKRRGGNLTVLDDFIVETTGHGSFGD